MRGSIRQGPDDISRAESWPAIKHEVRWREFKSSLEVWSTSYIPQIHGTNRRSVEAHERAQIWIEVEEPTTIAKLDSMMKRLQDLITISLHYPCAAQSTRYRVSNEEDVTDYRVELFSKQIFAVDTEPYRDPEGYYLFSCRDLPFETLVPKWLDAYEKVPVAIQMLAGQHYINEGYVGTRLLTSCAALESLHRDYFGRGKRLSNADFKLFKEQARAGVEQRFIHRGMLFLNNDYDYDDRIRELLEVPDQEAVDLLLSDRAKWLALVHSARNVMAHASERHAEFPAGLQFRLSRVTRVFMVLVLARWAGVSAESQRRFVSGGSEVPLDVSDFKAMLAGVTLKEDGKLDSIRDTEDEVVVDG